MLMTESYNVKVEDKYPDMNLQKILREEMFKMAVKCSNEWSDNISQGRGAEGSHGGPYINTGEARDSITIVPDKPDSDNYKVGSDKVQVAIAEFGRAPGEKPPPFKPIARWVQEKGIAQKGEDKFYPIVKTIQKNIGEGGLEAFAPGRLAYQEAIKNIDEKVEKRIQTKISQ